MLDREPCELVSEPDPCPERRQHPRRKALGEVVHVLACELLEELDLDRPRDDCDRVEQAARALALASGTSKNGVANRRRDVASAGGQNFGDVERVPTGRLVEASRRLLGTTGELADRLDRER